MSYFSKPHTMRLFQEVENFKLFVNFLINLVNFKNRKIFKNKSMFDPCKQKHPKIEQINFLYIFY